MEGSKKVFFFHINLRNTVTQKPSAHHWCRAGCDGEGTSDKFMKIFRKYMYKEIMTYVLFVHCRSKDQKRPRVYITYAYYITYTYYIYTLHYILHYFYSISLI